MTLLWVGAALVLAGAGFFAGSRWQSGRDLRAVAAEVAALRPGDPAPSSYAELRHRLTSLGELHAECRAELDRMRADRQDRMRLAEQEQRQVNGRLRRRAKEAIDDTGAVIGERLRDVVAQVGAARDAANATQQRVSRTSAAATTMVHRARSADEAATALNDSLHQVAGIASVISEIASQTRMLALNATIEAARAGDAGKGFAVVADEVKSLADTTASSTEQIAATIAALEADVVQMSGTLAAIVQDVGEIETAMGTLDGIADDQQQIVEHLNRTVDATMLQIADLSEVAERLERRRGDRLATDGRVTLRPGGGATALSGRLVDLSADGLGCAVPAGTPVKVGDPVQAALELDGTPLTVGGTVVRRREVGAEVELGLELTDVGAEARRRIDAHISRIFEAS